MNHEQQYSIWSAAKPVPGGWQPVTIPTQWLDSHKSRHPEQSARQVCLAYIGEIWQDLRPMSVRRHQAAQAQGM